MRSVALLFVLGFALASQSQSASAEPKVEEVEASQDVKFKLLKLLLGLSKEPLPKGKAKHCSFQPVGGVKTLTLGVWIAWNLSFFDQKQKNSIGYSCEPAGKKKQRCQLDFNADSEGESPWSCGFRFVTDADFSSVDLSTVECIGSC